MASTVGKSQIEHSEAPAASTESTGNLPEQPAAQDSELQADQKSEPTQAVRFKSTVEEINPEETLSSTPTLAGATRDGEDADELGNPGEVTPEQLRALSKSLRTSCPLQERRMNIFSYEPVSLPASRTASHEDSSRDESRETSRQATRSSARMSPSMAPTRVTEMSTPPLTPAGTDSTELLVSHADQRPTSDEKTARRPDIITPQESSQEPGSPNTSSLSIRRPDSSGDGPPRPVSADGRDRLNPGNHRKGMFAVGPSQGGSPTSSVAPSRESSPSRAAAASQFYSRHAMPSGDANDPYSANRRQAQTGIDSRFVFSRKKKHGSPGSSTISLPRASTDKRHSAIFTGRKEDLQGDDHTHSRQSSMADLKRFFKLGQTKQMKRSASPAISVRSGIRTPPKAGSQIPFGDDHGLTSKYGKLGKVLGAGAGGSVRLMKRSEDGVVFAVKEFRPRHSYETEREYVKKLTAEYCMGSSLHHGNIIETLDIVQEKGKWYEVMEYAPYDLFAIVMTGKMSREEISCCFLQIFSGVTYLHSMGLAHRDLKLDNVVVSDRGIMKIIDFGSAHVFKYPFENNIVLASGIVGSDPYLAPEVYDEHKYDPAAVDIWSLAIIFCCMTLRRFPWKVPRMTDSSFKLFAAEPTPGHDPKRLILPPSKSTTALDNTPERAFDPQSVAVDGDNSAKADENNASNKPQSTENKTGEHPEKKEVVRGPWRILRLLPRESRHIIGRMLEIDPKKRAKMVEILEDPWVANTVICRQIEAGIVINAEDHTHILEPPASATTK